MFIASNAMEGVYLLRILKKRDFDDFWGEILRLNTLIALFLSNKKVNLNLEKSVSVSIKHL